MTPRPPRLGLFGILGAGNIGNDASMDAVIAHLRQRHPDALLDAMTTDARRLRDTAGIDATPMGWSHPHEERAPLPIAVALKLLGKVMQAIRTARWVRRHDVVIVPGMGVLEASVPLRPWETPYALFLLSVSGKLFGTRVALPSVGAEPIAKHATRWLLNAAARQASYRSYRDEYSRNSMRARGLDVTRDAVYPDLAFSLPALDSGPGDPLTVGIGVMDYRGHNDDDRSGMAGLHAAYVDKLTRFVRRLLDDGRRVRLFVGDTSDRAVVEAVLDDARAYRPDLPSTAVVAEPVSSFADLQRAMAPVGAVVATRYHNVVCALLLAKPVVSVEYAAKNTELMTGAGLADYCLSVRSFDVDQLVGRLTELESRAEQVRPGITEYRRSAVRRLDEQFAELSARLLPPSVRSRATRHSA